MVQTMRAPSAPRTIALLGLTLALSLGAQRPADNGPRPADPGWHALIGGTAIPRPGARIENATIVIRNGRIESIDANAAVPAGARLWDCSGLTIYPAFIEPYLPVELDAVEGEGNPNEHHNDAIRAHRHGLESGDLDGETREALVQAGFGVAALAPDTGVFRGRAAVVHLRDPALDPDPATLRAAAYHALAFDRSLGDPNSEMGVIAAMRQTLADVAWHVDLRTKRTATPGAIAPVPPRPTLEALADPAIPLWFEAADELETLRAAAIATEFDRPAVVVASGLEFRRLDAVAKAGLPLVLPLDFPKAPDVSTIDREQRVTLRDLMTWEQAPTNPSRVAAKGIEAAFTSHGLDTRGALHGQVRRAIEHGLDAELALAMLTTVPAKLLGVANDVGTLAAGRLANLTLVAEGELFEEGAEIDSVWVRGHRVHRRQPEPKTLGTWTMVLDLEQPAVATLVVEKGKVTLRVGEREAVAGKVQQDGRHLDFAVDGAPIGVEGTVRFSAHGQEPSLLGTALGPDGRPLRWTATRASPDGDPDRGDDRGDGQPKPPDADEPSPDPDDAGPEIAAAAAQPEPPLHTRPLPLPFGAYGRMEMPKAQDLVLTGATVWTCGEGGRIDNGALWIQDGKIRYVGSVADLPDLPDGTRTVAVNGKHLTPGLIDCHSHTGISRGINESGQAVTAEVRVQDVVDPDDIGWYRELAGGVTTVQQLHGSANVIGGQSHVAKLRWGTPDPMGMSVEGAPGGIKFALGENPRRANSTRRSERYPSTRLGVEALLRDRFLAAQDYQRRLGEWNASSPDQRAQGSAPRRDLELEALAEILRGERFIHCHSYRQDEIFMLCRMADEFGFVLGTLQHVLEGYKVADAIAQSAKGASSFSDWWAYKLEVADAIPHNGALMHEAGVVVSFNSDSDELARRLNTEAAKAIKYGGVRETDALRFVTINPAIQLGIEDRVGSLEAGKDADVVLWSDHPLTYRARAVTTWVDGRPLYSIEDDRALRAAAHTERQRLIQRAAVADDVAEPRGSGRRARYWFLDQRYSCCEAMTEEGR